jgi:hypothetical protein
MAEEMLSYSGSHMHDAVMVFETSPAAAVADCRAKVIVLAPLSVTLVTLAGSKS